MADEKGELNPARDRQATVMELVGGQEIVGHQLASAGDGDASSKGGGVASELEPPFSSSYLDTNLSIPNIVVESFKSNQPEPDYSWEPLYVHTVAKIEVPASCTRKAAPYVKQVIEPCSGMYKPEGRLFLAQEDEEPRRF